MFLYHIHNPKDTEGNSSIYGTVIDKGLGTPVEYATIVINNQKDSLIVTGTITTEQYSFAVNEIPRGKYHLVIDTQDYYTDFRMLNETPVVRLSFSYRIHNYQKQHKQEEEINIGGGGMF